MRSLDLQALRALRTHLHQPAVEAAVRRFSALGEHGGVWLAISLAGAAAPARRPLFLRAAATVAAAYLANQTVKVLVRRRRPELPDLPPLTNTHSRLSYPSAHATTSFAGARALSPLLPPAPLYALAVSLALSRPYLGVHYPSDAVAGAALGTAVAELAR
jgi:membrane-associated phospholipid phosphatase